MYSFSEYILDEEDIYKKIDIMKNAAKKASIFFDKTVVFKTLLAKLFIETMNIDVDKNIVLTACLLYACKKPKSIFTIEKIRSYAKESAEYLATLGFSEKFCKICLEHNRYNDILKREKESDILELVDHFGGMMMNRPERIGFQIDEAIILLEQRNLKGFYNRYLSKFKEFIKIEMEIII